MASLGGGVAAQSAAVGSSTAALPAEGTRCAGPVALVGVREGALWLVDARGLPFVLPMSHPGMRARSVAAHGDAATACLLAEHGGAAPLFATVGSVCVLTRCVPGSGCTLLPCRADFPAGM